MLIFLLVMSTILPAAGRASAAETVKYADGEYDLPLTVWHETKDEASSMARYVQYPSVVIKDGQATVTVTLTSSDMITAFQVAKNGNFVDTDVVSKNKTENTRVASFKVDDLAAISTAKVSVDTKSSFGVMNHVVRLKFDTSGIPLVTPEEPKEEPKEETPEAPELKPEEPKEEASEAPEQKPEEPKEATPVKPESPNPVGTYADGKYDLPLTVLHEIKDEASSMGRYVQNPAVVIKNGEATVTVTLTNSDMITAFQVAKDGNFVDTDVVSKNETENTRVASFKVDDLASLTNAKVSVDTGNPNFGIMHHGVRLQFDTSGIPLVTPEEPKPEEPKEETPEVPELKPEEPKEETPEVPELKPEEPKEVTPVKPESPDSVGTYTDGKYNLPLTVLHETKDEASSMGRYVQNPSVVIKDGQATVSVTLTSSEMITAFQVVNGDKFVDTNVVSKNEMENTRVASFKVDDLASLTKAKVSVDTKSSFGVMNHGVRLKFDTSGIPLVKPGEPKPEEPKEETPKVEPEKTKLEDGEYTINFRVLHATKFEKSTMAGYVKAPALLSVKDGKNTVTFTLTDHESIEDFKVEQNGSLSSAKVVNVNEAANERDVSFEVDNLNTTVNANVEVHVNMDNLNYTGKYDVRLAFEVNSIEKKAEDKIDAKNLKDGKYSIAYEVLENNTNETSMMNDYVVSPGNLTVKDGKKFIAITLKSSSWITDFEVELEGKFITPKVLSTDSKADTRVVEFEVEDLFKKLNGKVSLDIPAYNYKTTHDVQIAFDTDSIKLLKDGKQPPTDDGDGTTPQKANPTKPGKTDDGLAFDRDADASTDKSVVKSAGKKGTNPKTGDTTKTLLFVLLLVGSLIPLVIKYRKRLVA